MKNYLCGCLLALTAISAAHAAPTIRTIPSAATFSIGDSFTVQVEVSGLGDFVPPSLGVFDLDVSYDPSIVSVGSASFGAGLDVLGLGSIQGVSFGAGAVNLFELSLDSIDDLNNLQLDTFVLATINLAAIGNGGTSFELTLNAIGDAEGLSLDASIVNGRIEVAETPPSGSVPEPGSLAMVAAGIGLAAQVTRRTRRSSAAQSSTLLAIA